VKKTFVDPELGELTEDQIAGDLKMVQLRRGHRYSLDDVTTAWEAAAQRPNAKAIADIGCGAGSVLLMLLWKVRPAVAFGVEAQDISFRLATRNIQRNDLTVATVVHGDLREETVLDQLGRGRFDLVTGTPPYLPPGTAPPSSTSEQRTYARIEMRGGIEDYVASAAALLAPNGRFVVCMDARADARLLAGAERVALDVVSRRAVVPREGKPALFAVWVLGKDCDAPLEHRPDLVVRDAMGERTAADAELRAFFGRTS